MKQHDGAGFTLTRTHLPTHFFLCVWLMSHALTVSAQEGIRAETLSLTPGQTVERTLRGGEAHSYAIKLKAGEYFHVDVDQRDLDVKLALVGPDGKVITERDRPNGVRGAEALSFIAKATGNYRFEVKALEEKAKPGKYEIRSSLSRTPTARDRSRIEAETLFQEGLRLSQTRTVESVKQACEKYETAAALWRGLGDKYAEALTLTTLGYSRESLEENEKAIDAHGRAVSLYRELKDKGGEASGLSRLSLSNAYLQKPDVAIERYQQAKAIYQELKDAEGEKQLDAEFKKAATAYVNFGVDLFKTGEGKSLRQALKAFAAAREMFGILKDRPDETLALIFLGRINQDLGNKHSALDFYNQALPLLRAERDGLGEGTTLTNIGSVYSSLGFKQKALDHYNQALPLLRAARDTAGVGAVLSNIGNVYSDLGENLKALDYLQQSLPLRREAKDKAGEGNTLNNIGAVYDDLGDKQRALDYYLQALPLREAAKDKAGKAVTLNNIGLLHSDLGEHQKAIKFYDQALPLVQQTGDKTGEARTLNNIGKVYDDLGNGLKALEYYARALRLWIELKDKTGEARTLSNIASAYSPAGNKQKAKALDYYNRALLLLREVGDKAGEAAALNNIGKVYDDLGNSRAALDYYTQALPLLKAVGNTAGEAATFHNMMFAWVFLKNPRLAIFYGKQSVNAYQHLRSNSQELEDKEYQKSFLKTIEYTYRYLAKLLIDQGRLTEAHQVLNGFKDQQYFDFNRATLKKPSPVAMTEREEELSSRYEVTSKSAGDIGAKIEELKRETGDRGQSAEESKRLQRLEADLKAATYEFLAVLKQAETGFGGQPDAVKDKSPDIDDTNAMRAALRELNKKTKQKAVAIYTLVGDDSFQALIITPKDIVPVISSVKGVELNEKAKGFLERLREVNKQTGRPKFSQTEVQKSGRELYGLVFAPVAAKLEELNIKPSVLMWSLDGRLRYVPVAALYDGKRYLAERYRNVIFTRAETKRMLSPVSREWTGAGFYNSKDYSLPVLGKMKGYPGLKNAKSEVETIFGVPPTRGIINGKFLPDDQFTKGSFVEGLRQRPQLIHIASHFSLVPGDASSSFLLLGDGNKLTLADIKDEPDDLFSGVELLTLSACETAAQKERESDGREIDSFAELAQRKGAQAIVASLWNVDDQSTSGLMTEFYQKRQSRNLTKAEALQTVQRSLLNDSNYSHPYYWSPFILIGNWR